VPLSPRERVAAAAAGGLTVEINAALRFARSEVALWQELAAPSDQLRAEVLAALGAAAEPMLDPPRRSPSQPRVTWRFQGVVRQGDNDQQLLRLLDELAPTDDISTWPADHCVAAPPARSPAAAPVLLPLPPPSSSAAAFVQHGMPVMMEVQRVSTRPSFRLRGGPFGLLETVQSRNSDEGCESSADRQDGVVAGPPSTREDDC